MRKELKKLKKFAKKIIPKSTFKKIKKLKDKKEKIEMYEHSIRVNLDHQYLELKDQIKKREKEKKDVFEIRTKLHLLHSKINFFKATLYKKDFKKMIKFFKEIKKELKHV